MTVTTTTRGMGQHDAAIDEALARLAVIRDIVEGARFDGQRYERAPHDDIGAEYRATSARAASTARIVYDAGSDRATVTVTLTGISPDTLAAVLAHIDSAALYEGV